MGSSGNVTQMTKSNGLKKRTIAVQSRNIQWPTPARVVGPSASHSDILASTAILLNLTWIICIGLIEVLDYSLKFLILLSQYIFAYDRHLIRK